MLPCLPQHEADPDRRARQLLSVRDELPYAWDRPPGVATAASVPRRLGFPLAVVAQVTEARAVLAANHAAYQVALHMRGRDDASALSTVEDCRSRFALLQLPRVAEVQDADAAFGWQRLAGPSPFVLRRLEQPPDWLREVPDAPLFVADYTALEGLPAGSWQGAQKVVHAPVAVFASMSQGLRPVAIRLDRTLTPSDGAAWELARLVVQAADANLHESFYHLGRAHFLLEAFALATERQLASAHPLYVLLAPHLEGTLAINGSARDELVAPGGQLDQLMAPTLEGSLGLVRRALEFRLEEVLPPADLRRRGVDDRSALPSYPWRDDALPIWAAIHRFVGAYLALAYPTPEDLAQDRELRAWSDELRSPEGGRLGGIPRPDTLGALTNTVAFAIFQASAGHAAVNYSQEDFLAYAPNMPTAIYAVSGEQALPPRGQVDAQLEFMVQQSRVRVNRLGHYPWRHFADPRVAEPLARFQGDLEEVERAIAEREATRLLPYPYLRPSLLTASIHI